MVRLFMRDGYPTKLCRLLSLEQRRRMFRACRVLSKRQFNKMLKKWKPDWSQEVLRAGCWLYRYRQAGDKDAKRRFTKEVLGRLPGR